jgi:NADH-quinone oxidoreductase subunit H
MWEIIFLAFALPISLLFEGIKRKVIARFHNRIGPPVWQPFLDIRKLFEKGPSDSRGNDNAFFRFCPFLYFVSSFVLFLFMPFQILSFSYDFVLLIYITILCSGFYVLVGFASNSPYGIVGSMREIITMVAYEMILTASVFAFMIAANVTSFAAYPAGLSLLAAPLATIAMLFVVSIEIKITPFDTAEADTEILYGYKTEFSSRSLAWMELARQSKSAFFMFFLVFLLFGPMHIVWFAVATLAFVFLFSLAQATTSRFRVDQVFKVMLPVLAVAIMEIIRLVVM